MNKRRRWFWLLAGTFGFLGLLAWIAAWSLRHGGLPQRSGRARIASLAAEVDVRFDEYAVPHVRAASLADLGAAVGWLQANERMTQLEIGRRLAWGRLAEVFGRPALETDRALRRLRLEPTARAMWESLSVDARALVEGYARGVNAWLEARRVADLPPGLRLLGVRPAEWRALDSLGFALLLTRDLTYPVERDELRFAWLAAVGPERLRDLERDAELEIPTAILRAARELGTRAGPRRPRAAPAPAGGGGSNNWVIAAQRSASGAPLVANDPHLDLALPCTWYEMHLSAPGYEAAGVTLPGLPVIVIGQGANVAWSFTNAELDTADLFFEDIDAAGHSYRRGSGWSELELERETIGVRFADDEAITLASTDIGPLLPADPERGLPPRSLAWTAHAPGDPLALLLALARAPAVDALEPALAEHVAPTQNLLAADRSGGTLFTVVGRLPERGRGDGRLPAPGWEPDYAWRGLRAQASNPRAAAAREGFLASANNDTRPAGFALSYRGDFADTSRVQRIRQRLAEKSDWSPAQAAALQTDVLSPYALAVVETLAGRLASDRLGADSASDDALGHLRSWDGRFERRGAAALFALVERELMNAAFGDELEHFGLASLPGRPGTGLLLPLLRGELDPRWFDDVRTPAVEAPAEQIEGALAGAWETGVERFGPAPSEWEYGSMHPWTARHPLARLPLVGRWFERGPFEVGGAASCIQVFAGEWAGEQVAVVHGPSLRWVADTAHPDASLIAIAGGQSGHPGDPHYADQIPLLREGRMRAVRWSEDAISRATRSRLVLTP